MKNPMEFTQLYISQWSTEAIWSLGYKPISAQKIEMGSRWKELLGSGVDRLDRLRVMCFLNDYYEPMNLT